MRDDESKPVGVRVYRWGWNPEEERREGVPWIGLFLLVFGALLLLERFVPEFRALGASFILAIGLAFLLRWVVRRSVASLYVGALITGLALPGVVAGLGIHEGPGQTQFFLGLAFLFIAAVRLASGAGVGWQAWIGVILTVLGGSQLIQPAVSDLILPILLVALGAAVVFRGWRRG
jgi:hypothetical protein